MSGNGNPSHFTQAQTAAAKADRRVLRTRDKLGDALVALMQEKDFDAITVQNVLDRAGVARSTFYTHYSDKDDLFLSDVEDFFTLIATWLTRNNAAPERLAPVRELFAHIADVQDFYRALVASGKARDVLALGQGLFARSIEERLLLAQVRMHPVELKANAQALAGALFSLLDWWTAHSMTTNPHAANPIPIHPEATTPEASTPEAMDTLFHRMAWRGLRGTRQPPR